MLNLKCPYGESLMLSCCQKEKCLYQDQSDGNNSNVLNVDAAYYHMEKILLCGGLFILFFF